MTEQTSAEGHETNAPTPPAPPAPTAVHPMEHIDKVVRKLGHGDPDVDGSGIAALLRFVAEMMGVSRDAFKVEPPKTETSKAT